MSIEKNPIVSVILPVYNGQDCLAICLDSLMAQDFPKEDLEILVVDNCSTDRTQDIIEKYPVTYLYEPNKGRAWARNKGIWHARGEFIAFIDSDCVAKKTWLTQMVAAISQDPAVAICGGDITAYRLETITEKYLEFSKLLDQKVGIFGAWPGDIPRVVTANAIVRKKVLEEVKFFDEDLVTYEDTELSWRVSFCGYEIRYVPGAVMSHQHIRTFWKFCRHYFEYGEARGILDLKMDTLGLGLKNLQSLPRSLLVILRSYLGYVLIGIRRVFLKIFRQGFLFSVLDFVSWNALAAGVASSMTKVLILKKKKLLGAKIPLEQYRKSFAIDHGERQWLFNHRAAWFLHNGLMKLVILSDSPKVYNFNKTATRIWQSIQKTKDVSCAVEEVAQAYDISHEGASEDLNLFMKYLQQEGILTMRPKAYESIGG